MSRSGDDTSLVLATLDLITDGVPQSCFDEWTATAAGLAKQGDAAGQAGYWLPRALAFEHRPVAAVVDKYQLRDVVGQIRTPLFITDPQDEQFWPGQSQQLYDLLSGPKELSVFTRDEGANLHCQPIGRELTHQRMFDWLTDQLGARSAG